MANTTLSTRRFSLGAKLSLVIVGLVVVMVVLLLAAVPTQIRRVASDWAGRRGDGVATSLAIAVQAAVEFDDEAAVADLLERIGAVDDVVYGVVVSHQGRQLGRWVRAGAVAVDEPARLHAESTGRSVVIEHGLLHVAVDIETKDPAQRGRLYLGFSLGALDREQRQNLITLLFVALIVVVVGLGAGLTIGSRLAQPLRHLADVTSNLIAAGDLRVDVNVESTDETGLLASAFREMVARLRAILLELKETALGLPQIGQSLSMTASNFVDGANTVLARVDQTSEATTSTLASLQAASEAVSTLDRCVERTNRHVGDMEKNNATVTQQVGALVNSVGETVSALEQMTRSVDETAGAVRAQDEAMARMLNSVQALESSTREIEATAVRTSASASETQESAVAGVAAIEATLRGIAEIHQASQTAAALIRELDERMKRIDGIVDVIREVADQTTLFSLNAAILSAQAGESGRGFAVIGTEIKALAQRTASSTTEIGQLLAEIQEGSKGARAAMERGIAAVDVGVSLGQQAATALQRITSSASSSVTAAAAIAGATAGQLKDTQSLNGELRRIADSIARISQSAGAQTSNNARLREIAQQMKTTTRLVETSTKEQQARSHSVRQALDEITATAASVRQAQTEQGDQAEKVKGAVVAMQQAAQQETEAARRLDETVNQLQHRAAVLQTHLSRFRL